MRMSKQLVYLRTLQLAAIGLVGGLSVAAIAALPPRYGGTVVLPLSDSVISIDPSRARRRSELELGSLIFDGLFRLDKRGRAVPHLARHAERTTTGWRILLRSRSHMHNGAPLRAKHVAESLERTRRGPFGGLYRVIRSVAAVGELEIDIKVSASGETLPLLLSLPPSRISVPADEGLVGTGPLSHCAARWRWAFVWLRTTSISEAVHTCRASGFEIFLS